MTGFLYVLLYILGGYFVTMQCVKVLSEYPLESFDSADWRVCLYGAFGWFLIVPLLITAIIHKKGLFKALIKTRTLNKSNTPCASEMPTFDDVEKDDELKRMGVIE